MDLETANSRQRAPFRVVLTGGPGGGKTTAADLLRREIGDRGTVDGGAYWPDGPEEFFASVGSTHSQELDRYDAVIFFETAACGGHGFESENRFRTESQQEAIALDARLRALWMPHPRFTLIPHTASFFRKMTIGVGILENLVAQLPTHTS